ncbi:MAG: YwaF family protein [Clostridia bacterium]|nr:YwaF family protein [Clostridia bacterium]
MFWGRVLEMLNTKAEAPAVFGWYHIVCFVLFVAIGVLLCVRFGDGERYARRIVLTTAIIVTVLEVYKMVNYTFSYDGTAITADFQWYAFPWQFCSTPMYVGLLTGLFRRGRVHDSLCAYLATFALFAGLCVMVYPGDVFVCTVGINIQTMICHGSMVSVGIYLFGSGYVRAEHKTVLRAAPVFCVAIAIAMILNEVAYRTGLLETETFNMFFISPYCDPSLPVYSIVQQHVAYPWCLIIYIAAFTLAAYLMVLMAIGIKRLCYTRQKQAV